VGALVVLVGFALAVAQKASAIAAAKIVRFIVVAPLEKADYGK
jgi:hypothetical protein